MMTATWPNILEWIFGCILIFSSLGVILARKPVYSSLSFLLTLLMLAAVYLEFSAYFIAAMQILVYAGAILVIFIFVIVLFQDAHQKIDQLKAKSSSLLLVIAIGSFLCALAFWGSQMLNLEPPKTEISQNFGSPQAIGEALYIDFFFPFEAVILMFLIAIVGALHIGKKGTS